jgi:hypothetical protein
MVDASTVEPLGKNLVYSYDQLDRLTRSSGTVAYTSNQSEASSTYSYDQLGNVLWRGSQNYKLYYGNPQPYQPDHAQIGLDGMLGFDWDAAGNLIEVGSKGYSYDGFGRMATATYSGGDDSFQDLFRYDHSGTRVYRSHADTGSSASTTTYVVGGTYEKDSDNTVRIFLDASGRRLAELTYPQGTSTPSVTYLHADALGSAPLGTSAAGAATVASDQDPYGLRTFLKYPGQSEPLTAGIEHDHTGRQLHGIRLVQAARRKLD